MTSIDDKSKYFHMPNTKVFYRFQGGNSYPSFNIEGDKCKIVNPEQYTYFSKSLDHHKYFVSKRLIQLIGKIVLEDTNLIYSRTNLYDIEFYKKVRKVVANTDKLDNLESLRFLVANSFFELLEDNYVYNSNKKAGTRIIERVDRRVFGGGYGVTDEWLRLFNSLTLIYTQQNITKDDILRMLRETRMGNKTKIECVSFLSSGMLKLIVNEEMFSDFTRFKIVEELEEILDKGLYNKDSELGKNPKQKIKEITTNYVNLRDSILKDID